MAGKIYEFKQKLKDFLKFILSYGYYFITALIPIYVLYRVFRKKNSIILAFAIAFIFLVVMDMICTIIEDFSESINKAIECIGRAISSMKKKKENQKEEAKRQEEEELKQLEELISEKKSYKDDVKKAVKRKERFLKNIKENKELLPKEVKKSLGKVYGKLDEITRILEQDPEEYYPIRHAFSVYFPEFERMTNGVRIDIWTHLMRGRIIELCTLH